MMVDGVRVLLLLLLRQLPIIHLLLMMVDGALGHLHRRRAAVIVPLQMVVVRSNKHQLLHLLEVLILLRMTVVGADTIQLLPHPVIIVPLQTMMEDGDDMLRQLPHPTATLSQCFPATTAAPMVGVDDPILIPNNRLKRKQAKFQKKINLTECGVRRIGR